jgi:mono/diheme cytochrome c family protein
MPPTKFSNIHLKFFFILSVQPVSIVQTVMRAKFLQSLLILGILGSTGIAFGAETNQPPAQGSISYLSPADQAKTFVLPPGYRMELVVSDPIIREPVVAAFDGDGKMYVAEMRTYMQNIEGLNQHTNLGCVSLHWSSKRNGVYDRHTVFADKLILPRMILPVADGVLINETDTWDIWLYRDRNGDGVSDEKIRVHNGGARGGNLEHQPSGLVWNLDNWMYMTLTGYRLQLDGTNMISDSTPSNGGQWGMSQDDYGKIWVVNASGEMGPLNFQQHFIYGRFTIKDELTPGYKEVWPLVGIPDVQGGEIRFRKDDKTLNHTTAASGTEIFRGDRLPADLRGDFLFAEPVGRLIRRSEVVVKDGVTYLHNTYDKSEFIRSSDPNFRPVNLANGPDGTLYIVDMYRGIIQEGEWVREDSYLRKVVLQYGLEKNFGRGRIWRLVHEDHEPAKLPKLQNAKPSSLVKYLEHPNGWYRDTAQKLIVLRKDKKVVPSLRKIAESHTDHLARIHAIWTLEGLGAADSSFLRERMLDEHPQVRIAAIRASETLCKKGDIALINSVQALCWDRNPDVVIQVMMTANRVKWKDSSTFINETMKKHPALGVQEIGSQLLVPVAGEVRDFTEAQRKILHRGENIYNELCFACHGNDGKGMQLQGAADGITMAPPLADSKTAQGLSDEIINVLLKGLAGPVNGKTYNSQMVALESNDDAWIAAVASYVRNSFGNNASFITTNEVARVRTDFKERLNPWTVEELGSVVPQQLTNRSAWKVTASHNNGAAGNAIDEKRDSRFDTGIGQAPDMWFQIELPEPTTVSGIYLDTATSGRDYPRGYKVQLSNDGKSWGKAVANGKGNARTTEIIFAPAKTKFIRITQTGEIKNIWWSIHDLHLLQPPDPARVITAISKKAEASVFE